MNTMWKLTKKKKYFKNCNYNIYIYSVLLNFRIYKICKIMKEKMENIGGLVKSRPLP